MKETWQRNLHPGDEITLKEGGGVEETLRSVIISEIVYLPDNIVRIIDTNGNKYECPLKEIS